MVYVLVMSGGFRNCFPVEFSIGCSEVSSFWEGGAIELHIGSLLSLGDLWGFDHQTWDR